MTHQAIESPILSPISSPILLIDQVYAGYQPDLPILQGVSLRVDAGEIVTIVGANGAGKSTLAKAILGLVPVTQGDIQLENRSLLSLPSHAIVSLGIGYVPQGNNIFPSLTIAENLEMGTFLRSLSAASIRSLQDEIYAIFPTLADRKHQRAGSLSGGERQMLALGKALILKPKLLVLDEPSAAISPRLVQTIFDLIQQINATGTAILLVEQNARTALKIAHRGYVLEQGRDRFTGSGQALLDNPQLANLYLGKA
ncbi:MAG: ABC transporter ATP-binding protein [Prochlorotrichaceae cyanobacterium]